MEKCLKGEFGASEVVYRDKTTFILPQARLSPVVRHIE